MNTKKIIELAEQVQALERIKFTAEKDGLVKIDWPPYFKTDQNEAIARELNGAIAPVLSKLRKALAAQLALCKEA